MGHWHPRDRGDQPGQGIVGAARVADGQINHAGPTGPISLVMSQDHTSYQRPVQLTCAQLLVVIEVTVLGSFAKKFQALQQASRMSS